MSAADVVVRQMTQSLHHRGPDGQGYWSNGRAHFGHARLSIIDLEGGKQPMVLRGGAVALTFNGEIYNYKELRQDLEERGHAFDTSSDTEVLLRMYDEYGVDCVERLNGMFAFAIWDDARRQLVMARDRAGEKPLYYAEHAGGIVFASELKSLRHFPGLPLDVDMHALDDYLAYGYVPDPKTIYSGVRKLGAANVLVWNGERCSTRAYWQIEQPGTGAGQNEIVEEFESLLADSTRIRLRSDVPVGTFLSGGIDSTVIAYAAAREYEQELSTYTIGFSAEAFDESDDAAFTARFLGTKHHNRRVDGVSLEILPTLVAQYDEPFADASAIPTYYVTREAARDLKVCLSGDGGDELFGGYPQYRDATVTRIAQALPQGIRRLVAKLPLALLPVHAKGYGWFSRLGLSPANRYQQMIGIFSPDERERLFLGENRRYVLRDAALLQAYFDKRRDERASRQLADFHTWLPGDILPKVDRSSMAHALEVRTPFLDHRLIEFAHKLPPEYGIGAREQKTVLREFLRQRVPAEILARRKRGFGVPLGEWFRGPYRDYVGDRLLSASTPLGSVLDTTAVAGVVQAHWRGQRDFSDRIWTLLWLDEWFRQFGPAR